MDFFETKKIQINLVKENAENPRVIGKESVEDLIKSIKHIGVIEPIKVFYDEYNPEFYTLIDGHRRLLAAKKAKLKEIPATIVNIDTAGEAYEIAAISNMIRASMNPADEAIAVEKTMRAHQNDAEKVAKIFGQNKRWVTARNKLASLGGTILDMVKEERLTLAQCTELLKIESEKSRNACADRVVGKTLSETSAIVQTYLQDLSTAIFCTKQCSECPNRSKRQTDLFGESKKKDPDLCLDQECFAMKHNAHIEALIDKEKELEHLDMDAYPGYWGYYLDKIGENVNDGEFVYTRIDSEKETPDVTFFKIDKETGEITHYPCRKEAIIEDPEGNKKYSGDHLDREGNVVDKYAVSGTIKRINLRLGIEKIADQITPEFESLSVKGCFLIISAVKETYGSPFAEKYGGEDEEFAENYTDEISHRELAEEIANALLQSSINTDKVYEKFLIDVDELKLEARKQAFEELNIEYQEENNEDA